LELASPLLIVNAPSQLLGISYVCDRLTLVIGLKTTGPAVIHVMVLKLARASSAI